jgi:uncharacterized membrane protein YidH (DUF202 family)
MITNNQEEQIFSKSTYARDHMANERTFLAWVRTSIGIMAFGFVVEKFALFIKQIALLLGNAHLQKLPDTSHSLQGYSSIFGVCLVALGVLICLLAFIKYKQVEKQIDNDTYHPSLVLNVILTLSILLTGVFLIFYLNSSI